MRKLTLNLPETHEIEINGEIFGIRRSDIEILNKCAGLQAKYRDLKKDDLQNIKAAVNETADFIDEMLGEGAMLKISGGKPVNAILAIEWVKIICAEINNISDEYIKEKYG